MGWHAFVKKRQPCLHRKVSRLGEALGAALGAAFSTTGTLIRPNSSETIVDVQLSKAVF